MSVNKSLILINCSHNRRKEDNSSLDKSDKSIDSFTNLHYQNPYQIVGKHACLPCTTFNGGQKGMLGG